MPQKISNPEEEKQQGYTAETVYEKGMQNDDHWVEDPEEVFEEIVRLLEGYEWNEEKKKYVKHTNQQMMNRQGKQPSKVFLTGSGNKITYITDMEREEITSYLKENHFTLAEHLIDHYEEYGIDFEDLGLVFNALMNVIWSGTKRAEEGTLMRFKKNTERKQERIVRNKDEENKGKLRGLSPW